MKAITCGAWLSRRQGKTSALETWQPALGPAKCGHHFGVSTHCHVLEGGQVGGLVGGLEGGQVGQPAAVGNCRNLALIN